MTDLRKAAEMALEALESVYGKGKRCEAAIKELRQALAEPEQEWDSRHPKAQALIRERARLRIELGLVEQLVDDPHFETMPTDMEYWGPLHDKLKEALTQPVDTVNMSQERVDETAKHEHEPVGYINGIHGGYMVFTPLNPSAVYLNGTALYTALPKREWVGLTDEELEPMCDDWRIIFGPYVHDFSKAIEAKLKEKNT